MFHTEDGQAVYQREGADNKFPITLIASEADFFDFAHAFASIIGLPIRKMNSMATDHAGVEFRKRVD